MFDLATNELVNNTWEPLDNVGNGFENAYRMAIGQVWEPVLKAMKDHTVHYMGDVMHDAMAVLYEMRKMDESGERPLEEKLVYTVGVRECGVDCLFHKSDIHYERYPGGIFHITLQCEKICPCSTSATQVTFRTYKEVNE